MPAHRLGHFFPFIHPYLEAGVRNLRFGLVLIFDTELQALPDNRIQKRGTDTHAVQIPVGHRSRHYPIVNRILGLGQTNNLGRILRKRTLRVGQQHDKFIGIRRVESAAESNIHRQGVETAAGHRKHHALVHFHRGFEIRNRFCAQAGIARRTLRPSCHRQTSQQQPQGRHFEIHQIFHFNFIDFHFHLPHASISILILTDRSPLKNGAKLLSSPVFPALPSPEKDKASSRQYTTK